ncbi:hypothetical protein [uncultured Brevundimonas sp.]|uniref:hypothetical protein n=1 Tax=uncultured Brevundimonas sp. TaxID=213418 RepID=UPI0025F6D5A3|nr:hypothetical protein [uncultured Brevundimonas sp.]
MSNEAPTDALRLVPTKATPQQLETAAFNLSAEIGAAEAMKLGPHIERAYELLVAAAPASPLPGGGDEALIAELKEARKHLARCVELVPAPGAIDAADAFLARNGKGEG